MNRLNLTALTMAFIVASAGAGATETGVLRVDPLERPSLQAPIAARGVMLSVTQAGSRIIAAGERGLVLWSDDQTATWRQAQVPVSVTLTALSFASQKQGWAVGHGGVILHTEDGGQNWSRQTDGKVLAQLEMQAAQAGGNAKRIRQAELLVSDGSDKPLLDVHFWDEQRGFVIGAYGLIFGTEDGGRTWSSWSDRVENPRSLHLNSLYVAGEDVYLVGEQGLLLRSSDGGERFQRLESPYHGSWFAVTGTGSRVVLAGLRGTVFWSDDGGTNWTAGQVPAPVTILSAVRTNDGQLVFVNQSGQLLVSTDEGRHLQPLMQPSGAPLNALALGQDGGLLAASFAGVVRLPKVGLAGTNH